MPQDEVIGHLQPGDGDRTDTVEIKNMAVRESWQGRGVGARLVRAAILVTSERAPACACGAFRGSGRAASSHLTQPHVDPGVTDPNPG